MKRFDRLQGIAAPFPLTNVDTDKILPARHLTTISRNGLGAALFSGMRYDAQGREEPSFILNRPPWRDAVILIAGPNFGCGSSREHAPWALLDFGIRCVIAPSFADIFRNNCIRNGILPIALRDSDMLMQAAQDPATATMTVDLVAQQIAFLGGRILPFDIDPPSRTALLEGRDAIEDTLARAAAISAWERQAMPLPAITADAWREMGKIA